MKKNVFRSIALALALVMALGCFTGCKSSSDNGVSGVVDINGVAGSEIKIEIPQGGDDSTTDDTDNGIIDDTDNGTTETPDDTDNGTTGNTDNGTTGNTDNGTTETPDNGTTDNGTTETPDDNGGEDEVQKPAYDESKELVVVSYNIKCAWYGKTIDQVVSQIQAVDADIVGFQEVDYMSNRSGNTIDQIATIAAKAGYEYYCFEPVISLSNTKEKAPDDATTNLYGHAVMSKYPIKKSEIVWPDAQSTTGEPRNFGRHEIDVDGTTIVFYNGHLDGTVGRDQYFELQEKWMNKDEYAICVGDFNETYSEFQAYFDYDKYYSFAFGEDGESVVKREQEGKEGSQVIDHIIVTKDKFVWKNGGSKDNGYYITPHDGASDHDMIYCYLNIIK